jgi:hypothetical protein
MDEFGEMRRQKKTFPVAWKVRSYALLQHMLPPYLLSLTGPLLKVVIVNHRHLNFVNLPGKGPEGLVLQYFDVRKKSYHQGSETEQSQKY